MPTNDYNVIPKVMDWLMADQPKTILDVGCGFGIWAMLAHQYLGFNFDPKEEKKWAQTGGLRLKIWGVEISPQYVKKWHKEFYEDIFVGSIVEYVKEFVDKSYFYRFDCALLMDVIEHLSKDDGLYVLRELSKVIPVILVSTPLNYMVRKTWDKEALSEEHLSGWNLDDFKEFNVIDFGCVRHRNKDRKQLLVKIEGNKDSCEEIIKETKDFIKDGKE